MARAQKTFDAHEDNTQVGQDHPRDLPVDGPAKLDPPLIEPVEIPRWKEKAAALAFFAEPVTIVVHESSDPNSNPIVGPIGNNGRSVYFQRGDETTVERRFVESLARAKKTTFTQQRYTDGSGYDAYRQIPHTALEYPFSVIRDDNPNGRSWLKGVLAEK